MAKHCGGRLYDFLTFLCHQPKDVGLIAHEMGIARRNVHRLIADAENFGMVFTKEYHGGRLVSIAVTEKSLDLLDTATRILEPRIVESKIRLRKSPCYSSIG